MKTLKQIKVRVFFISVLVVILNIVLIHQLRFHLINQEQVQPNKEESTGMFDEGNEDDTYTKD